MQIQVNEKNEVTGYATVGGFPDGIEADIEENAFDGFSPGKYIFKNGAVIENPDWIQLAPTYAPSMEERISAMELAMLEMITGGESNG